MDSAAMTVVPSQFMTPVQAYLDEPYCPTP